jgi:hypothetical protein
VTFALVVAAACSDSAGGDAGGGEPAELRALVDSLLPALEQLSGLEAIEPVRVERRSVDQVRAYVEQQLTEELPPDELEGVHATYALLGLIPDTLDLRALLLDLYTEQIVGYYDPETETLYAVEGVRRDALRPVLAHELVHALQDQHANLDSLISGERGNDRQVAAQAAIEGHATLVMFALLAGEAAGEPVDPASLPNPAEQLRIAMESPGSQLPVFSRAPAAMREMLLFPYVAGAGFVQAIWRADAADTSRHAPLGEHLPHSTEQVLWPMDRFIATRDAPTELRFDSAAAWRTVHENTLGAFESKLFLQEHLGPAESHALGWDGDRFRVLEDAQGRHALIWYSLWDDAASADAFTADVRDVLAAGSLAAAGAVRQELLEGRSLVRIVIAPSTLPADSVPEMAVYCANEAGQRIGCGSE